MKMGAPIFPGTQGHETEQDLGKALEQGLQGPLDQEGGADRVSQKMLHTWTHPDTPRVQQVLGLLWRHPVGANGIQVPSS